MRLWQRLPRLQASVICQHEPNDLQAIRKVRDCYRHQSSASMNPMTLKPFCESDCCGCRHQSSASMNPTTLKPFCAL